MITNTVQHALYACSYLFVQAFKSVHNAQVVHCIIELAHIILR